MRRIVFGAAVIVVCTSLQGCDDGTRSRPILVTPSAPTLPAPPAPQLPVAPSPKLEISAFSVSGFDITLRLTETGGEAGANIVGVYSQDELGNEDGGCALRQTMRVEPGGTWDIRSMGNCAPSAPFLDAKTVTVVVGFVGDDRVRGQLIRTIPR